MDMMPELKALKEMGNNRVIHRYHKCRNEISRKRGRLENERY
jgi:hypothetical protein